MESIGVDSILCFVSLSFLFVSSSLSLTTESFPRTSVFNLSIPSFNSSWDILKIDFNNETNLTELENIIKIALDSKSQDTIITAKNASTLRILVAEDDKMIREIIQIALDELTIYQLEIDYVENGLEAFKKLYSNYYDFYFDPPKFNNYNNKNCKMNPSCYLHFYV